MQQTKTSALLRIFLFGTTIPYWLWLANQKFTVAAIWTGVVGAVAACYPIIWLGRRLLDAKPTQAQMQRVTTGVHFSLLLCLGTAIVVAIFTATTWRGWLIPLDRRISLVLMAVTGLTSFMTVINLAFHGLGAPFAIKLTRRVATDWFYAWTRNPMVLSFLAFFVALGLWFQSALFVIWVLIGLVPAWVVFLKVYEERELEIRLGAPYLEYRSRTAFMWPRRRR